MSSLVQLPDDPASLPTEQIASACRLIVEQRDEIIGALDVERAAEAWRRSLAVEKYVSQAAHKADARRAARILETAVGEALGPAEPGDRTDLTAHGKVDIHHSRRSEFRQMAEHRELWWPALDERPLSRRDVLNIISEAQRTGKKGQPTATVSDLERLHQMGIQFGCITADPPWLYGNQGTRSSTSKHYGGMTVDELCDLPIKEIVAKDAFLHLWTTNAFLFECQRIMEAWGFEYRSCFVWVKPQMGIGNYWRVSHEFLLLGKRGSPTWRRKNQKSWGEYKRAKHSAKPEQVIELVEQACDGPYLELFGRRPRQGWVVWGNEIERGVFDESIQHVA